jgi:Dyp-type peroxidase family
MQTDIQNPSKSLQGVTDLTLVAPIRRGLIPALDSRTYESRLRLLLKTLNTLRISSLEAEPTPLLVDAVDRIRSIHSFRLAIVGQDPRQLLLAVAFDGGWEAYMRRIWRDLGPLLDVIFCNCEGYLDAHGHRFPAYAGWVRSAQVGTEFFYNASPLTVSDLHYLRGQERKRLGAAAGSADRRTLLEQALPALAALYRLTDMYPPGFGVSDGAFLLRAARHLLGNHADALARTDPAEGRTPTEQAALRWFSKSEAAGVRPRARSEWNPGRVQGGIVTPHKDITHACLLLVGLRDAAAARDMLQYLEPTIARSASGQAGTDEPRVNLGLTVQGLALAGVPKGTLDLLPYEFREGMAARAGILGDLHCNHPTHWSLPERNWAKQAGREPDRVELSAVHAVVQYAWAGQPTMAWQDVVADADHPLRDAIGRFDDALCGKGVRILSVQSMQRFIEPGAAHPRDHFGFRDGMSQPSLEKAAPATTHSDAIVAGDLLLGYENSLGDPALTGRLWDDSTFLVVRKLRQDVEALNALVEASGHDAKQVRNQLVGRSVDGEILLADPSVKDRTGNDFDYATDPDGKACPYQSHIRRANPRATRDDVLTVPRIMRRGMSYGPRFDADPGAERGVMFMAYNASIAEQFEVVQAWLSGSNSSHPDTYSALRDPLIGVPQDGDPHAFVFHDAAGRQRVVAMPPERPVVMLQWGLYAFVPSIRAIAELNDIAAAAARLEAAADSDQRQKKEDQRTAQLAMQAQKGAVVIARLRRVEQHLGFAEAATQWKIALEDVSARMSGISQWVWAAIRQLHRGVLRTPYGVLVCSGDLVNEVLENRASVYSVTGYAERMRSSFGEIYLGKDDAGPGSHYRLEARASNEAIMGVKVKPAFESALVHLRSTLDALLPAGGGEITLDVKDIVDDVLARISREWFGLPDGRYVMAGGWHWKAEGPPTCPGHFHSPSRYMFQPNPGPQATQAGQLHGRLLKEAVRAFVDAHWDSDPKPGRLAAALFAAFPTDREKLASTLIGVMMGFLPTVDGNLRGALYEWISDRSLWDHQLAYLPIGAEEDRLAKAQRILLPPLQQTLLLRPVPELVWRTALKRHDLGPVEVTPGDRIVVSIVSATQECLIDDKPGLFLSFGGNRRADDHPTHACPGYMMAIGVMLGVLAGLMESVELKPTMSPMALRMRRLAGAPPVR